MHRRSHQELEKASGQVMQGNTKVRRLLKSLQASTMAVPVATIRALEPLRSDFDASVNYLRAFISNSNEQEIRNVAGFTGKKKDTGDKQKVKFAKKKGRTKFQKGSKSLDRYYKPDEWWGLDKATREKILELRKKRNVSKVSTEKIKKQKDKSADDSDDGSSKENSTSQRNKKRKTTSK
jgi:hypothetical protein